MKHKGFTGKSLPVYFFMMSVRDLRIVLEILEEKIEEALKAGGETLTGEKSAEITVPLRHLAEALYVSYTVSIEFGKIKKALKEIRIQVEALVEFEKDFFRKVKEENRIINEGRKGSKGRSVPLRIAAGGGWPSSAHS